MKTNKIENDYYAPQSLDSASLFMHEVSKYPVLNSEETITLFKDYKENSDREAKSALVNSNMRLVIDVVKRYIGKNVDFMDLVQEGLLGLDHSIDKFDYTKGIKFSTYATTWISKYVSREVMNSSRNIRIPTHVQEDFSKVLKAKEKFVEEFNEEPDCIELSDYMDNAYSSDEILDLFDIFAKTNTMSLDCNIYDDVSMYEVIADKSDSISCY